MLSNASLSGGFWTEAMKTIVHVINTSPSKSLDGGIPKEAWIGKKSSSSHLHIFGFEAYARVKKASEEARSKGKEMHLFGLW